MANVEVISEVSGSVWKVLVAAGDTVAEDQEIAILESMKMEIRCWRRAAAPSATCA